MNEVSLNGDSQIEAIPTIKQKALRINLNENIYGTFAEIGAGRVEYWCPGHRTAYPICGAKG